MTSPKMPSIRQLADVMSDLVFPGSCLACGCELRDSLRSASFCKSCRGEMQRGDWPVCRRCAARIPRILAIGEDCGHCRDQKLWFDRTLAFGDYDGILRNQCLAMKTDRSERIASSLGRLLAVRMRKELMEADAVLPVPMHGWRRIVRGTNPPSAIARAIGKQLSLPVYPKLLHRRRNTQPQLGLSNPARFRNVRGDMQVRASYDLEAPHLLLVDDVLTTGATCSEAARVLKRAGAKQVTVVVVARTAIY